MADTLRATLTPLFATVGMGMGLYLYNDNDISYCRTIYVHMSAYRAEKRLTTRGEILQWYVSPKYGHAVFCMLLGAYVVLTSSSLRATINGHILLHGDCLAYQKPP